MADEGNESRIRRVDLNLYLGLPRSPRPRSSDLGSDLALNSLPLSTSSTTEESQPPLPLPLLDMSHDSHAPYSPSHASITPEPNLQPIDDLVPPIDGNSNQEYTPYFPSYDQFNQLYEHMVEPVNRLGVDSPLPPPNGDPLPTLEDTDSPVRQGPLATNLPSYIPLETQEMSDEPVVVPPLRLLRPYIPHLPSMLSYVPRSPSYSPPSPPYSPRSPPYVPTQAQDLMGGEDGSSSRRDVFETPEFRFRRLIESSRRLGLRRFRSSLPYNGGERPNFGRAGSPGAEQLMLDIMSSQRNLESNGKHKLPEEGIPTESSEEEKEDKNKTAANFECNICMDMAEEPVVTSCGHLFCWPCLYQWLHIHCEHKECPVCKGEVTDANVTPIYGRGSSGTSEEVKVAQIGESNVKIPPRPRGNRFESLRQQFQPISRRMGEGLATSWRRLVSQQMRGRNRFDGSHPDPILPGMVNGGQHPVLTRLRARRLLREELTAELGADAEETRLPRESTTIPLSDDARSELWERISRYNLFANDRLAAISADIRRVVGNANGYGASTSSVNPPNPEVMIPRSNVVSTPATDQASVSSTTAVIQGDFGFTDGSAEPNSAGSSRSYRRRGRSGTSGSQDVDEILHARKRRRTN